MTRRASDRYPVIDLFAGPGGLGEGFASLVDRGRYGFDSVISVEQESFAHQTLLLRHFFRSFPPGKAPAEYYGYLAGELTLAELALTYPREWEHASNSALKISLGADTHEEVRRRIADKLKDRRKWVLVGGPPCQAYSLVGRSRRANDPEFEHDEKHFLYREYLRIITDHRPPVFVMENVKGLLSARVNGEPVLQKILDDLSHPKQAVGKSDNGLAYRLFSLSERGEFNADADPKSFVVKAEEHGVPQARHRMFIVGIRSDIDIVPEALEKQAPVSVKGVIGGMPRIRSGISRAEDSHSQWRSLLKRAAGSYWFKELSAANDELGRILRDIEGSDRLPAQKQSCRYSAPSMMQDWYCDERLGVLTLHEARSHMETDIHRYFFASSFSAAKRLSPKLADFPDDLLPAHRNIEAARDGKMFSDRFRVQLPDRASTTITSHISKDGHYYIHYDPTQCRSLTVREAARLQTFPDNYHFEGPRTSQYHQVGNAVPPYLASQIARIVKDVLDRMLEG